MKTLDKSISEYEKLIFITLKTTKKIFGSVTSFFSDVSEPRHESYIEYNLPSVFFTAIFLFLFRLEARNKVNEFLRTPKINNIFLMHFNCGVPHGDTIDDAFALLDIDEVAKIPSKIVKRLIKQKFFNADRTLGKYLIIAVDGTGLYSSSKPHSQWLRRTTNGKTTYLHYALEAKLISKHGEFSVGTAFVENEHEDTPKQDCELKAFYRLAEELKKIFPRTKLLLTFDGLYPNGPVFSICKRNGWKYMIVLKNGCLPSVHEEFTSLTPLNQENKITCKSKRNEARQEINWVNDVLYKDTKGCTHKIGIVDCIENRNGEISHWRWVTNIETNKNNVEEIANDGGRLRWRIENAFNTQKNRGFALEHQYSRDPTAAKIFYYSLQIADMLSQLIKAEKLLKEWFPRGFSSAKALAMKIMEAFRNYSSLEKIQTFQNEGYCKSIANTS
ncbi:MAG: transposase family protein [Candidatus Riflebacteria bacterium]|nr:transposase family protein [Candidatus Riflebacteria bacterium]